jgi:hypothetical protein
MVRQLLPLDQIIYTVLVSDIAFAPDIRKGLGIGMNGCQQKSKVRNVSTRYLVRQVFPSIPFNKVNLHPTVYSRAISELEALVTSDPSEARLMQAGTR